MTIADKLVLQRQHHLKWRSFDRLELVLMMRLRRAVLRLLAVGDVRHRHPHHRPSLAVAAGSHLDAVHLCDLHRRGGRHPPQRSSVSDRDLRGAARHAAADRRDHHPPGGARRRVLPDLVRLYQLSPRLRQFPPAVGHADRLALCGDPARRRADRAVHGRATGQRHPQRIRSSGAAGRGLADSADRRQRRDEGAACERTGHPRADVVLLPVLRLSRRAGAVFADGGRVRRRGADRRFAGGDRPEDFRRRGFRSAAGDSVLPAGRRTHEFGQCGGADRQPVAVAGRAYQGRAVAGRRRLQHVLLGNVGIDHRRRRRDEPRAGRPDEAGGLQPRLHRRDHRIRLHHRGAGAAEHHRGGLWRGRQRLDRRACSWPAWCRD